MKINTLIVEDHPLIAEAYHTALIKLSKLNENYDFHVDFADTSDTALKKLKDAAKNAPIDLVLLDIKIPKSHENRILSGEDLGIYINEVFPNAKIMVLTSYDDNFRINNILKSVNPDGFLVKNDATPEVLLEAIESIMTNPPYYSHTVIKLFRKQISNDFFLDKIDRQLLYELSIGTKTVDLPNVMPMSIGGIERRKRQLKEIFNVSKMDDKVLVEIAKEKGFI